MAQKAGLVINFDVLNNEECKGRVIEISDTDYTPGKVIIFSLWAITADLISDLTLWRGCKSMGSGSYTVVDEESNEVVSFEGSSRAQLTFPSRNVKTIFANTDVTESTEDGTARFCVATEGNSLTNTISQIGFSCIGVDDNVKLYGSVNVKYEKARFKKSWIWTVPNKSGDYWFSIVRGVSSVLLFFKATVEEDDVGDGPTVTKKDITFISEEFTSEILIERDRVIIDEGTQRHKESETDSEGRVTFRNVEVGDHTVRAVRSGYIDTDLDDLANDTFRVG